MTILEKQIQTITWRGLPLPVYAHINSHGQHCSIPHVRIADMSQDLRCAIEHWATTVRAEPMRMPPPGCAYNLDDFEAFRTSDKLRIALYSDLHREIQGSAWEPPTLDADVVILAGDIGQHTRGLAWASSMFQQPVVYVAGNHEYYEAHLGLLAELQKPKWEHTGVHFLERQAVEIAGVRFLGCTLWSGFDLHGADKADAYMAVARRGINDYWMIRAKGGKRLEPRDTRKLHQSAVRWLDTELSKPFTGKTVVVTHFAPHPRCVAPEHQGSDVSPYFVSDLSWLMDKHQIDLWCYGHTHTNISFVAENGCRVVSNQRGYPSEQNPGFQPGLVIEV